MVKRAAARTGLSEQELEELLKIVTASLHPLDGSVRLFNSLYQAGYPLYCCSNIPEVFIGPLEEQHRFFDLFWGKVYSSRVGFIKPEPEIYRHLLTTFGLVPEETVFIDDLRENVEGARRMGMKTIHFTSVEACRQGLRSFDVTL
jgi:putative hydrolase of the HAD superfamily